MKCRHCNSPELTNTPTTIICRDCKATYPKPQQPEWVEAFTATNQRISQLQQQLADFENRLDNIQADNAAHQYTITALMTHLQKQMHHLTQETQQLNQLLSK